MIIIEALYCQLLKNLKDVMICVKAMESNQNFATLSISQPLAIVTLENTASACHHRTVCPVHGVAPFLASQEPLLLQ